MNVFNKVLFCAYFIFFLNIIDAKGQQDLFMSQYMFNNLSFNPAYAGFEGRTNLSLLYHNQWTGYAPTNPSDQGGAPQLLVATFTTPLYKLRSGVGLVVKSQTAGPVNDISSFLSYAYHVQIKDYKLSLGLSAGFISRVVDKSLLNPNEPDPAVDNLASTVTRPDISGGVFFQTEKFYLGLSYNHLLKPEFNFGQSDLERSLESQFVATAGYDYYINTKLMISPSVLVSTDFITANYNVGTILDFDRKFWGGVVYKNSQALGLMLGLGLLKNKALRLGYAFDYVFDATNAKQATSHELQATYFIPINTGENKKIIRTPRFRH